MKISIIIPVYNVSLWIRRCLLSVCHQTYHDIECIIIDDVTPDESMSIVDEFLKEYNGENVDFKVIRHEVNRGLSAARNTGVEIATGDYLFFLDSDDELHSPDAMSILCSSILKYGDVDFAIGDYQPIGSLIHMKLSSEEFYDKNDDIFCSYIKNEWPMTAWGKLISHSFFLKNEMWFQEGLLHEDELFSFRLAVFASKMVTVHNNVYKYYIHENSITGNKKYQNFSDYQSIILQNYNLIKNKLEAISHYDINMKGYFIAKLWSFAVSVVNSKLSKVEKRNLLIKNRKMVNVFGKITGENNYELFLKYIILQTPYKILTELVKVSTQIRALF